MIQWLEDLLFPRKVLLVLFNSGTKIVTAERSQAGWVAKYFTNVDYSNVILLKGGKVAGYSLVKAWAPLSGWSRKDLDTMLDGWVN